MHRGPGLPQTQRVRPDPHTQRGRHTQTEEIHAGGGRHTEGETHTEGERGIHTLREGERHTEMDTHREGDRETHGGNRGG